MMSIVEQNSLWVDFNFLSAYLTVISSISSDRQQSQSMTNQTGIVMDNQTQFNSIELRK